MPEESESERATRKDQSLQTKATGVSELEREAGQEGDAQSLAMLFNRKYCQEEKRLNLVRRFPTEPSGGGL